MKRESFQAAIYRLAAELLCDFRDGKITRAQATAELRLARKELLRALGSVDGSTVGFRCSNSQD